MSDTFHVWCPDDGHEGPEDGIAITNAYSAQNAAEIWADQSDRDSGDYTIVGGSEATVRVQDPNGEITEWVVFGEQVPSYSATWFELAPEKPAINEQLAKAAKKAKSEPQPVPPESFDLTPADPVAEILAGIARHDPEDLDLWIDEARAQQLSEADMTRVEQAIEVRRGAA